MMIEMVFATLAAAVQSAPPAAHPVEITTRPVASSVLDTSNFTRWLPGDIVCDNAPDIKFDAPREPMGGTTAGLPNALSSISLSFDIDEQGRPLAIKRAEGSPIILAVPDIMPSLAASRFAATGRRHACTVQYTAQSVPIADAPFDQLLRHDGYSVRRSIGRDAYERLAGSDCGGKLRPRPITIHYPDLTRVTGSIGARDWLTLVYDLNEAGAPVNLRTLATSGNADLETEARKAVVESRFQNGPSTGCLANFGARAKTVEAPPVPDNENENPARCDAKDRRQTEPVHRYPPAYLARQINGWAIVRYDVAPWGEIGNVRVIDAQPTEDFGVTASSMIRGARYKPSDAGVTGCVERVRFVMREDAAPESVSYIPNEG